MNIKPKIHDTNQSQLPGPQTAALIGGIYNNGGDRGNDQQDDDEAWAKGCFFARETMFFLAKYPCVLVNSLVKDPFCLEKRLVQCLCCFLCCSMQPAKELVSCKRNNMKRPNLGSCVS